VGCQHHSQARFALPVFDHHHITQVIDLDFIGYGADLIQYYFSDLTLIAGDCTGIGQAFKQLELGCAYSWNLHGWFGGHQISPLHLCK
jgi:hypothetical protein